MPTYENAANDLALSLPVEFAPGDGLCVTLDGASMRLVPLEGDFTHPSSLENAVRYNEVFPDVDVQYTAQELMVKKTSSSTRRRSIAPSVIFWTRPAWTRA